MLRVLFATSLLLISVSPSWALYDPDKFPGTGSVATFHKAAIPLRKGNALLNASKPKEAMSYFKEAIAIYPYASSYYVDCGCAALDLKDNGGAVEYFKKSVELAPDNAMAHADMAEALTKLKHYGEAEAACKLALRLEPSRIEALINLAQVYLETGRMREAKKYFLAAKKIKAATLYLDEINKGLTSANGGNK